MKKIIITALSLIFAIGLTAQTAKNPMYYQKMGQALGQFGQAKTAEDFNAVSNQFLLISNVEKEEWLPLYYATHAKIVMSFMEPDATKKDAILDEASAWFDKLETIAATESEVYALKAMFYSARLSVDPMTRGQEYMMKSNAEAFKALNFDENNPRAQYMILANKVGFAKIFGSDISAECNDAKALLENWGKYEVRSRLHPSWGKEMVEGIASSCEQ